MVNQILRFKVGKMLAYLDIQDDYQFAWLTTA